MKHRMMAFAAMARRMKLSNRGDSLTHARSAERVVEIEVPQGAVGVQPLEPGGWLRLVVVRGNVHVIYLVVRLRGRGFRGTGAREGRVRVGRVAGPSGKSNDREEATAERTDGDRDWRPGRGSGGGETFSARRVGRDTPTSR